MVDLRAELGSAIPEGMKGVLHLDWYDPNNVLANISTATNNGHGTRDNDEEVVYAKVLKYARRRDFIRSIVVIFDAV